MKVHKLKFKDADGIEDFIEVEGQDLEEALTYYKASFPVGLTLTALTTTTKKSKRQDAGAGQDENKRVHALAMKALQ